MAPINTAETETKRLIHRAGTSLRRTTQPVFSLSRRPDDMSYHPVNMIGWGQGRRGVKKLT